MKADGQAAEVGGGGRRLRGGGEGSEAARSRGYYGPVPVLSVGPFRRCSVA